MAVSPPRRPSIVSAISDLAERLIVWGRCSDPGGVMDRFVRILRIADLDIDTRGRRRPEGLIDEVLAIAEIRHPGLS